MSPPTNPGRFIPLVVASQFPLSFAGSIVMTQVLYTGLLAGVDPRLLLIDIGRQLKVRVRDTHDWASVVAYASFPADLDRQLPLVRLSRAEFSVEAALNHADRATQASSDLLSSKTGSRRTRPGRQDQEKLLEAAKPRLAAAMDRMRAVLDTRVDDKSLIYGRLARAEKRKAEIFWRAAQQDSNRDVTLGARTITPLQANARNRRAWAVGMLLELLLLEQFFPTVVPPPAAPVPTVASEWPRWIAALLRDAGEDAWEVHSTRRQLGRWVEFFPFVRIEMAARKNEPVEGKAWDEVKSLATQMFDKIPEPPQAS